MQQSRPPEWSCTPPVKPSQWTDSASPPCTFSTMLLLSLIITCLATGAPPHPVRSAYSESHDGGQAVMCTHGQQRQQEIESVELYHHRVVRKTTQQGFVCLPRSNVGFYTTTRHFVLMMGEVTGKCAFESTQVNPSINPSINQSINQSMKPQVLQRIGGSGDVAAPA